MPFPLIVLFACLSMAARDFFATLCTVAESHNRGRLAGIADALNDLASLSATCFGAAQILNHGITWKAFVLVGSMMVVSAVGTEQWTKVSTKWAASD